MSVMLCDCSLCIDLSVDHLWCVFENYLLNEFVICFAVENLD